MAKHQDSSGCSTGGVTDWDEVKAAANNTAGEGGKGFRHVRCDGFDLNGGGLKVDPLPPSGGYTEFWARVYMRWASGFAWSGGAPGFSKDLHWFGNAGAEGNFGWHSGGVVNIEQESPGRQYSSTKTWASLNGGSTGDGLFHCYEWHYKRGNGSNGVAEIWVDDTQVANYTNGTQNATATWNWMVIGSNQNSPLNGATSYTDFDDIAVSIVGRIGCTYGHP